ncbi:MAG TPA: ABC transporter ATP-binding protein, partial [Candidatus Binatia bacterium]|nr:ABC transporter ATP-binding protein [Candidatus Binatia bacterium]
MAELIKVKDLRTSFFTPEGEVRAIDGISFEIGEGKTLGLVGESGCGKSVTSLSIMRLIASPPGKIVGGEILYRGRNLLKLKNEEMRKIRGNEISMIFQEPMTSLNPVFTVGNQIGEAIRLHQGLGKKETRKKTIDMLRLVKIADPESRVDAYPHQLSGGM